jgi:hypothetical protein
MADYSYPGIFLSYGLFFLFVIGAAYFLARSWKHGYWGKDSEAAKYRMLRDDDEETHHG